MEKDPPNRDDDSTSDVLVNKCPDSGTVMMLAPSLILAGLFVCVANSLFEPATLIPLSTRFDSHDPDDRRYLYQKVDLLPVIRLIPSRWSVNKRCYQKRQAFVQKLDPRVVFLNW